MHACPECGREYNGVRGIATHRRKVHGVLGAKSEQRSERTALNVHRYPNPLACPWYRCTFVASTVAERNEHALHLCGRRKPIHEYDPVKDKVDGTAKKTVGAFCSQPSRGKLLHDAVAALDAK
jgi:hypothetical protein